MEGIILYEGKGRKRKSDGKGQQYSLYKGSRRARKCAMEMSQWGEDNRSEIGGQRESEQGTSEKRKKRAGKWSK